MSASNEYTEWHLTPRGWTRGTERVDFSNTQYRDPPRDRVLSIKYYEFMSSGYSKMEKGVTELFRSEDSVEVERLLGIHGDCLERL